MKAKWILTIVILVMLGYQAWRVFDYMQGSLTGVDDNTSWWIAMAFLTFTEIGLLTWLHVAQPGATTRWQENVSNVMIWFDYAGSMVLGLADIAKHNTLYQVDLTRIDPVLFFAPWIIVVGNVGAWILYETTDSGKKLEKAERALKHAEHELEVQARQDAIAEIQANREALAKKLAPYYFKDISDRVTGRTVAKFTGQVEKPLPDESKKGLGDILKSVVSGNGNGNGTHSYNSEAQDSTSGNSPKN